MNQDLIKYLENLDKLLKRDAFSSFDKFKEAHEEIFVAAIKKGNGTESMTPLTSFILEHYQLMSDVTMLRSQLDFMTTVVRDLSEKMNNNAVYIGSNIPKYTL